MSKKKDARQVKIRNILMEKGQYRVKDLAAILHVTPETLRKDLDELEEQGIVVRSHGFARVNKLRQELPISVRNQENTDIKKRLTYRAIEEIQDGNIVYLDAGSTLLQGIDALRQKKDLTIITNSLPRKMLDSIYIDIALFGSDGLLNASGFTVYSMEEVGTRRHVINQTKKVVMVSDNTKFSMTGHYSFCSFREVDVFITDRLTEKQHQQVQMCKKIVQIA